MLGIVNCPLIPRRPCITVALRRHIRICIMRPNRDSYRVRDLRISDIIQKRV